jgi:phospholipase/carboxylesterase
MIRLVPLTLRSPERVVVYIHGWTGDENSMDVFSKSLPTGFLALFPRGPIIAPGGFGWVQAAQGTWTPMPAFEKPCRALMQEIEDRLTGMGAAGMPLRLVGFSQGGAVCHALTALYPRRIERTAVLAGFFPKVESSFDLSSLSGKSYFIAHGRNDLTIPVEKAYESIRMLEQAGASVEFCESDSGHKLALECLKRLQAYITK